MKQSPATPHSSDARYDTVFHRVAGIVEAAKLSAARSVNAYMTGAYWMIGRHIVEYEQSGEERAAYGANLIEMLATDMTRRFGRGFSRQNLWQMRQFGLAYPPERILQTLSGESAQPLPRSSNLSSFPLPWSRKTKRSLGMRYGCPNKMMADDYDTSQLDEGLIAFVADRAQRTVHAREGSWSCRR